MERNGGHAGHGEVTGGIQGRKREVINRIVAGGSKEVKLNSMQTRRIVRKLERPLANRNSYPPTWSLIEREEEEEEKSGPDRQWWDHRLAWVANKKKEYCRVLQPCWETLD